MARDIDTKPKFQTLKHYSNGTRDTQGRDKFCDNHPETKAVWVGKMRPISRIMVYPFSLCDECFQDARNPLSLVSRSRQIPPL